MADAETETVKRLAGQLAAMRDEFDAFKRRGEAAMSAAIALQETYRQAYAEMLEWIRAGQVDRVEGFLQAELAHMEAERQHPNA